MVEQLSHDKKVIRRQVRILFTVVSLLILLIGANFYIALANPNEKIQTIVGGIGPRGHQGDKGEKGDSGETGPIGPQGIAGPQGEQGLQGQSIIGATGFRGARGEQGEQGLPGINGDQVAFTCNSTGSYVEWKYVNQSISYPLIHFNPLYLSCESFTTPPIDYDD